VKVTLRPVIVLEPDPDAHRAWDRALDLLADAIAEQLIAEARAEVARELGLDQSALEREREHRRARQGPGGVGESLVDNLLGDKDVGSLTETARASLGLAGGGR